MADKTAKELVDKLQDILVEIPAPVEILCDNGAEFTAEHTREFLKQKKIRVVYSPPYRPQANGVLERFHGFLNRVMRMCLDLNEKGEWWPAVRAALDAYRKTPHTATGETPMFLWTGRDPVYCIDHLLPTTPMEIWRSEDNRYDLAQLKFAYALARRNTCLARLRNRKPGDSAAEKPRVGDRVYRRNHKKSKLEFPWMPGYRVVETPTSGTVVIEHSLTGIKSRCATHDVKIANPVAELLMNTSVDILPGKTKMYFSSEDLKDLQWSSINTEMMDGKDQERTQQVAKDRDRERQEQNELPPAVSEESEKNGENNQKGLRKSSRRRRRARMSDYIYLAH